MIFLSVRQRHRTMTSWTAHAPSTSSSAPLACVSPRRATVTACRTVRTEVTNRKTAVRLMCSSRVSLTTKLNEYMYYLFDTRNRYMYMWWLTCIQILWPAACFEGYQYACRNGPCIDIAKECDGIQHCPEEHDDEDGVKCRESDVSRFLHAIGSSLVNYRNILTFLAVVACPEGQWKCNNFQCISKSLLCNNRDDCGDFSDEMLDNCSTCCSPQF